MIQGLNSQAPIEWLNRASAAAEGQIEQKMLGAPVWAYLVAARADLSVPCKSWLRFDAVRHLY